MGNNSSININKIEKIYDKEFERRIELTNLRFQEKTARELASLRQRSIWECLGGVITCFILVATCQYTKNRLLAVPIPSIAMFMGYRMDRSSGKDFEAIKTDAEQLLKSETDERRPLLKLIGPPITLKELDKRISLKIMINR